MPMPDGVTFDSDGKKVNLLTWRLGWYVILPSSQSVTYFFFHSLLKLLLLFL